MRRFVATAVIAMAAVAVPGAVTFAEAAATTPPANAAQHADAMRLRCEPRVSEAAAAVTCRWSETSSAGAAGYRLWRLDPTTDESRQIVFRTGNLSETGFTDERVRPEHRYVYAVQAVTAHGRVVGQSRPEWVRVPPLDIRDVEVLRLRCELGPEAHAVGCRWSRPATSAAHVVTLWRSVDGGPREVVERFRPSGPNAYRDRVPEGATRIVYAVIVTSESGRIVARSRAEHVAITSPDHDGDRAQEVITP